MANKPSSSREQELEKVVATLGDAMDKLHEALFLIQPGLSIWKKYGEIIEECRKKHPQQERKTK